MKRTLVDYEAIKREVLQGEAKECELRAERTLLGTELAVLWAMITRYELEVFSEVESADFFDIRNRSVFNAIRELEARGMDVDGEFLLSDIAARIEDLDRQLDKHVRDKITDEILRALADPPVWVVRPPDRESIRRAVERLQVESHCRRACPTSARDAGELAGAMLRRHWGRP